MANIFDQFDKVEAVNVFDQFDGDNKEKEVDPIPGAFGQAMDVLFKSAKETERLAEERISQLPEYQQEIVRETSMPEAALIGMGKGFEDILSYTPLVDKTEGAEEPFEALKAAEPISAGAGEIAGQAAPFVPLSMVASGAAPAVATGLTTAGVAPRIAAPVSQALTQAQVGALEGAAIAEDKTKGAAAGAAIAGGFELASPILGRIMRKAFSRFVDEPVDEVLDASGGLTQEAQETLWEARIEPQAFAQEVASDAGEAQQIESVIDAVKSAARSGNKQQLEQLVDGIRANPEVLDTARRLGVDDLLMPSMYSDNPAFRELEGALSYGTELGAARQQSLDSLKSKAAETLENVQGKGIGDITQDIRSDFTSQIDNIIDAEDSLYTEIAEQVPRQEIANTSTLANNIIQEVADLGGDTKLLSKAERDVLNLVAEQTEDGWLPKDNITNYAVDRLRKSIGEAIGRKSGPFADTERHVLRSLYGALSDSQGDIYAKYGLGDLWEEAKDLTKARKGLESEAQTLFGKNLDQSAVQKLTRSVDKLSAGNVEDYKKLVSSLPEDMRDDTVLAALEQTITRNKKKGEFDFAAFDRFMSNLNRNKTAKQALYSNLAPQTRSALNDWYTLSQAINKATGAAPPTGVTRTILDAFESGSLTDRVYQAAKEGGKTAVSEGMASIAGMGGVPTAFRVIVGGSNSKEPATQAAQQLLSSDAFRRAVTRSIETGNEEVGNKMLDGSGVFKKWASTLPEDAKRAVASMGAISYLTGEDNGDSL